MRRLGALVLLAGCTSESWLYGPTASQRLAVEEGETVIDGEAVLRYARASFPEADEIVSNALRLTVHSQGEATLEFPEAHPDDLGTFAEPNVLNLHDVYQPCDEERCEVVVPFRITRERDLSGVLRVTGDAILSVESVVHRTLPESNAASLEVIF